MPGVEKELMLGEIQGRIEDQSYLLFSCFDKLNVQDIADLRKRLRKVSSKAFVVKKTLLRRSMASLGLPKYDTKESGLVFVVACNENPQVASKVLVDFSKGKNQFKVAGGCAEGVIVGAEYVTDLSSLPSRQELLAKLVGGMKSPVTGFVFTLRGLLTGLVGVLDQISKKKDN